MKAETLLLPQRGALCDQDQLFESPIATSVSRCHHQTILPSSSPRRNKSRADCGAWAMSSKTFFRFSSDVPAVSKYQSRSGCLNGVSVVCRTFKPAPSHSRLQL